MAAIAHGADAVYIGAERFGARAAAGNSVADIALLCKYAHQFGAKVYVTTNTIIYNSEMEDTLRLIKELQDAGADAFLVQDMGLLQEIKVLNAVAQKDENYREIVVHASTQTDNRTAEKVAWLASQGCRRVVLARELSLEEIREIHEKVPHVELEVFVHGALCVSYSGLCYASQYCFQRSANRGECAQFCRMKFDLVDADGKEIVHQKHLLSLKDLCLIDHLDALAEAGAVSFKIEGRLKDVSYVKNVVSAYSKRLDEIVRQHPDRYQRASWGKVSYTFTPDLRKTFNRTFTEYFYNGRVADIASFDTPKALGEYVGQVKSIQQNSFIVKQGLTPSPFGESRGETLLSFSNGDGLCFFDKNKELVGFRVNRAEGNRLYPQRMPAGLQPGMRLYRNYDETFQRVLSGVTAERRIEVKMVFGVSDEGFSLKATAKTLHSCECKEVLECEKELARQSQRDNIIKQLTRLGNTIFVCSEVVISDNADRYFIPSSLLADLRRKATESLSQQMAILPPSSLLSPPSTLHLPPSSLIWHPAYEQFPYVYNMANRQAENFYSAQGVDNVTPAFELLSSNKKDPLASKSRVTPSFGGGKGEALLMQCRHCLRFALGHCTKHGGSKPTWHEPLSLRLADGTTYPLHFNCQECQMEVYSLNIEH